MAKLGRIVLQLIASIVLAVASYWLLGLLLKGVIAWFGTQSPIGHVSATILVYVSPLLFGFPLMIALAGGIYLLIWRVRRGNREPQAAP
jgi:hypothetical protein